jgi:electron transfer flavoprotein alpha subunit
MRTLIFIEHDHNEISSATLSTMTAAKQLGHPIDALLVGSGCETIQNQAQQLPGVEKLFVADHKQFGDFLAENIAPLMVDFAQDYDYIVQPHTTHGKNIMPRLAGLLNVPQVSDIMEIVDGQTYVRPIYAGNAYETVQNTANLQLITVRPINFDPVELEGGQATIESVDFKETEQLTQSEGIEVSESDLPELATASIVVSGGRGVGSKENFALLEDIAKKLDAAIGASRAAVDAGYISNDYQVGQTGKVISPTLYIAVGLSGAIQHLAGMKDSKYIVAINKDPDAPIFNTCDYGLVADLFECLPELSKAIDKYRT